MFRVIPEFIEKDYVQRGEGIYERKKTGLDKCCNLYYDSKMHMLETITHDKSHSIAILTMN